MTEMERKLRDPQSPAWLVFTHPATILFVLLILLIAAAFIGGEAPVFVAGTFAVTSLYSAISVAHRLKPRPALRETSALFARLDWFGRYLVGAFILCGGIVLSLFAQAVFDSAPTPGSGLSRVLEMITITTVTWVIPIGALIVVGLISSDLLQSGPAGRSDAFLVDFPIPLSVDRSRTLGRLGSVMSDPRFAAIVVLIYLPIQLANS